MLGCDEDALICDLAETYHIYEYRMLPARRVASFCVGLGQNSRIKKKLRQEDSEVPVETLLLAAVVDNLKLLVWLNSEDGATGNNRPSSIVHALLHKDDEEETQDNDKFMTFESPEDYNEYMRKKMEKCQT